MMYWYLDFPHRHSTLQCVPVAERAITSWVSCCLLEIFIHLVVHLLVGWTSVALLLQWIFKLDKLLIEQLGGHSFSMEILLINALSCLLANLLSGPSHGLSIDVCGLSNSTRPR